jgi:hypothetical protein
MPSKSIQINNKLPKGYFDDYLISSRTNQNQNVNQNKKEIIYRNNKSNNNYIINNNINNNNKKRNIIKMPSKSIQINNKLPKGYFDDYLISSRTNQKILYLSKKIKISFKQ